MPLYSEQTPTDRFEALHRYGVFETPPEKSFDRLTELVAGIFDVPISLLVFLDEDRQWLKSATGLDEQESGLERSFCAHTVGQESVVVVEDATVDPRFADNPRVTGEPGIRFFAGAPLETSEGYVIGSLCAIDKEPRSFSGEQERQLEKLAAMVVDELELRRETAVREQAERRYRLQNRILELVNNGASLKRILGGLLEIIEDQRPNLCASIVLYDKENGCLRHGAAPSLPDAYNEAINGVPVGPKAGSCGTAIHTGKAVVAEDITTDPRWEKYKDLALRYGLKACWSIPIKGSHGQPIGSFAIYYKEARKPPEADRELIYEANSLARLAIERHRDAQTMHAKERRFDTVFNDPNILVGLLTPEGRVIDINDTALGYLDETLDEIKGDFFWETPWFNEASSSQVKRIVQEGAQGEYQEFEWVHEIGGERQTIHGVLRPVFNETGKMISMLVSGRDITKRKRIGEQLQKRKEWFQSIAENVAEGIFRTSRETGVVVYANQALAEMFGFEGAEDVLGADVDDFYVDPIQREKLFEELSEGETFDGEEILYRRRDGSTFTGLLSGTVVYDDDGKPVYHDGAINDISEQIEMQEALKRSRDFLRRTEMMAMVGGWEFDVKNESVNWTSGSRTIHQVSEKYEPSLDEAVEFYHPEDRKKLREALQNCLQYGESIDLEARIIPKRDDARWVRVKGEISGDKSLKNPVGKVLRGTILDINDQKETEDALRRSREFLQRTENIAKVGGWEADVRTGKIQWTQGVHLIYGMPEYHELTIEKVISFYHPEDKKDVKQEVEECIETGKPFDIEKRIIRPDGEVRWIQVYGEPIEENGEIVSFRGAVSDVTAQKETEQSLRESERKLRGLANSIPGVLYQLRVGSDGLYSFPYVSRQSESLLGIPTDVAFEDVITHIPKSHRADVLKTIEEAVAQKEPAAIEFPFVTESGKELWLHAAAHPEEISEGLVFNGVLLDITEQIQAERESRVLAAAVEQAGESLLIAEGAPINEVGPRILYVNPAFEEMTGYSSDEVIGETPHLLQGPETDIAEFEGLPKCLEEGRVFTGEAINYKKDGTPFILSWTVAPVYDGIGELEYWVAVLRDVTEEREREHSLRQAKEEAEEAVRLKSSLLNNVSHEIRTPLTSVIGFAEVIEEMDLGPEPIEFTRLIQQSGRRLLSTLNSVLDLSQLQSGTMDLNPQKVNLSVEVSEIVASFCPQARKAGVHLHFTASDETISVVQDVAAIQRVLANLIGNAIKFTPEGGEVAVHLASKNDMVELQVEDTGVGIDEDFLPDLFGAFKQESTGITRDYEGVGLGLPISKRIVDLLGGKINVESTKGEGTCFTVHLPRCIELSKAA